MRIMLSARMEPESRSGSGTMSSIHSKRYAPAMRSAAECSGVIGEQFSSCSTRRHLLTKNLWFLRISASLAADNEPPSLWTTTLIGW